MPVKRLVFIRPGETDWNTHGRWQGWVAAPLNQQGRAQARSLAKYVRNIGMAALYTSDLKRALETAECLAEQLGYEPIRDERLRERNIGLWQGLTIDEMRAWYPREYALLLSDVDGYRVPAGESRTEVRARALKALEDILRQDRGETIGILTHTTTLRTMLEDLIKGYDAIHVDVHNTSVTTLRRSDSDRWELVAANDCIHLEGLLASSLPEIEHRQAP